MVTTKSSARVAAVHGASARGAVSSGAFAAILATVIGDCGAFGLGLLQLGFGFPTSATFSVFVAW
jgi:hypothetical protein